MQMRKVVVLAGLTILALGAVGGCTQHELTPELMTLEDRPVDVQNSFSLMSNENWRMFVSDWQRAAYIDRPSRLTPEPLPR